MCFPICGQTYSLFCIVDVTWSNIDLPPDVDVISTDNTNGQDNTGGLSGLNNGGKYNGNANIGGFNGNGNGGSHNGNENIGGFNGNGNGGTSDGDGNLGWLNGIIGGRPIKSTRTFSGFSQYSGTHHGLDSISRGTATGITRSGYSDKVSQPTISWAGYEDGNSVDTDYKYKEESTASNIDVSPQIPIRSNFLRRQGLLFTLLNRWLQ